MVKRQIEGGKWDGSEVGDRSGGTGGAGGVGGLGNHGSSKCALMWSCITSNRKNGEE
jgi:hypothetical protein